MHLYSKENDLQMTMLLFHIMHSNFTMKLPCTHIDEMFDLRFTNVMEM